MLQWTGVAEGAERFMDTPENIRNRRLLREARAIMEEVVKHEHIINTRSDIVLWLRKVAER